MADKALNNYISETLQLEENSPEFKAVSGRVVKYLMCGYSSVADFHRDIARYVSFPKSEELTAAGFRKGLADYGRLIVNVKYYCLNVAMAKRPLLTAVRKYARYGLSRTEAMLIWNTFLKNKEERNKALARAKTLYSGLDRSMTSARTMNNKLSQSRAICAVLHKNAQARVRKKLRWVSDSQNIPLNDLTSDVMCKIIQAYHKSLPNNHESEHQLNYLRRSLENIINNENNYYSADKRKRMEKVGEGQYQMTVMSNNQLQYAMRNSDGETNYENFLSEQDRNHTDLLESNLSIERMLTRCEGTKKHKLYSAILGKDTTEFTNWLSMQNMLGNSFSCASDWMIAKPAAYVKKTLARWLGVTFTAVECGINRLQFAITEEG